MGVMRTAGGMVGPKRLALSAGIVMSVLMQGAGTKVSAQATLGLRGGLSTANLIPQEGPSIQDPRRGVTIGATATFPLAGSLDLHGAATYVQKGSRVSRPGSEGEVVMDYVDFPLLLEAHRVLGGRISGALLAGLAFSYQLTCRSERRDLTGTMSLTCAENGAHTRRIDTGYVAGAGVRAAATDRASVTIDAVYNRGVGPVNHGSGYTRHHVLLVLAGVRWKVGR